MQDCKETDAPDESIVPNVDVPLYDQLTSLKTWKEETAELCAAEEGRQELLLSRCLAFMNPGTVSHRFGCVTGQAMGQQQLRKAHCCGSIRLPNTAQAALLATQIAV